MTTRSNPPEGGYQHEASLLTPDGETIDITRQLAVLYDVIIGSLDWGSGFTDDEEEDAILEIGKAAGFTVAECGKAYLGDADWFATCNLWMKHEGETHQGDAYTTIRVEDEIAPGSGIRFTNQQHATYKIQRVQLGTKYWIGVDEEVEAP